MALTNHIQEALQKQAKLLRQPLTVTLELLPVCNLDCKMCYVRTGRAQVEKLGGLKKRKNGWNWPDSCAMQVLCFCCSRAERPFCTLDSRSCTLSCIRWAS